MHKIIYVSDSISFEQDKNYSDSLQLTDTFFLSQNDILDKNVALTVHEPLFTCQKYNYINSLTCFQQFFCFQQQSFSSNNTLNILNDDIDIMQNKYIFKNIIKTIYFAQSFAVKQSWCDSDNLEQDNKIRFTLNCDVLVNDVVYSTMNIGYYTFDIFDDFSFFVNSNLLQQRNTYNIIDKFSLRHKINQEEFEEFYNIQKQIKMYQKIEIDVKKYFVLDDKDGVIFNNKIRLTNGLHNFSIRKINTPKVYNFTVNVVSPYRKVDDKIYYLNKNDLQNAKLLSNYQIQQQQVDALNDIVNVD